ncbi:MAG: hypothetical protein DMF19_06740 [Verrucomicrobia bacterium]|nr:MAG: hypothetical protein DMF19_06740 [Verrucomicrobiota bacterium]
MAADCIGRDVPVARSQKQAQAAAPVNMSGGISHDKQEVDFQIAGSNKRWSRDQRVVGQNL